MIKKLLYFIVIAITAISCSKDSKDDATPLNIQMNKSIQTLMQSDYLWYDKMPAPNPNSYSDPIEFFHASLYTAIDKWSFMITMQEYIQTFEQATYYGHGFSIQQYNGEYRIALVFKKTKAYKAGIRRGWIIKEINKTALTSSTDLNSLLGASQAGISNAIKFGRPIKSDTTITLTKEEVDMNMVLNADTFRVANKTVAYLSFYGFVGNGMNEIDSAFNYFKKANAIVKILMKQMVSVFQTKTKI